MDPRLVFDIISAGLGVGWLIVGLLIKSNLADIKTQQERNRSELLDHQQVVKDELNSKHSEMIQNQHILKIDFDQKHAENTRTIAVHSAEDVQKFEAISRTLMRIDNKIDHLNGK